MNAHSPWNGGPTVPDGKVPENLIRTMPQPAAPNSASRCQMALVTGSRPCLDRDTAAGYRANRRAEAGADADLRRVFFLRGLGLLRVRAGRKSNLAPVGELQAAQLDREYGPPLHPPARIGVDDFALDQSASLGDHPIAVDDGAIQAGCKTIAVLVKFGGDRLVRGDRNGRALANRKDAGRRRRVLACGGSRFLPRRARWRGRRVTWIRFRV